MTHNLFFVRVHQDHFYLNNVKLFASDMQENLKWLSLHLYKIDMVKLLIKKEVDHLWSLE